MIPVLRPMSCLLLTLNMACSETRTSRGADDDSGQFLGNDAIRYQLDKAGQVSLNIYDAQGQIVRNLINAQPRTAGAHLEFWDHRNDFGEQVSEGPYHWKLLRTHGLKAKYLMHVGTSLPDGTDFNDDLNYGLGQSGPSALTVHNDFIYVVSGYTENVRAGLKMPLDGSRAVLALGNPNGSSHWDDVACMDGQCYYITSGPNNSYRENGLLARLPDDRGWNGLENIPGQSIIYPGDESRDYYGDYVDLCAYNSGNNPQLVISYRDHHVVRWIDPDNPFVLEEASIADAGHLAIENSGEILAVSGTKVLRFSRDNKSPRVVISNGLDSPGPLAVDRSNGDILVADLGSSQQIKRFSASGRLKATYGKAGGRGYGGLYRPENFQDVVDLAYDGHGGFVLAEKGLPMRIGRFDAKGQLLQEWYGASNGIAFDFFVDPDDPQVLWYSGIYDTQYVRAVLDLKSRTWVVHSVYNLPDPGGRIGRLFGTGEYGALEVKKFQGQTYLASRVAGKGWLLRLDEESWQLKPVSVIQDNFQWTDRNGDGRTQDDEFQVYTRSYDGARQFYTGPDLSWYLSINLYKKSPGDELLKVPVAAWDKGLPLYANPEESKVFAHYPDTIVDRKQHAMRFADGFWYEILQHDWQAGRDLPGWGNTGPARILKWSSEGQLVWDLKPPHSKLDIYNQRACQLKPGEVGTIGDGSSVDLVKGSLIVPGKDGAWNGNCPGVVHSWDRDGLWIDNLLSKGDLDLVSYTDNPLSLYQMGSEPWTLAAREKDADTIYLYGTWENHVRIWEVSGWDGWTRCQGRVGDTGAESCTSE